MNGTNVKHTGVRTVYSYCPHCGHKGLYVLHGKYCRCRYCGRYRILLRESDFWNERPLVTAGQNRGI